MQPRLTDLNYNEILLYLGHRGQEIPPEVEEQIRRCMAEVRSASQPRLVWRRLPVVDGAIAGLPLAGEDVKQLLAPCREAVVMAVTLGPALEQRIARREVTNMADAVILDACASTAVENVCDNFEADLREQVEEEGLFLTDRYSPGYGDLPLESQRALCAALDTQRRIGLTVTPSLILIPRKAVTAILGLSDRMQTHRHRGCASCNLFLTCPYRKEGLSCHE